LKTARQFVLALGLVSSLHGVTLSDETLTPRWVGDQLFVSAPRLHFLTGKSLERLHNGAAVPFDFQLTVSGGKGNPALQRALERFVVSYDVWEEKFRVVELRGGRKSRAHLTAAAVEAWCLENVSLPTETVNSSQNLWVKLEVRSAETKNTASLQDDGGISLASMIELFSRPTRNSQNWAIETGPFKLSDLRR
jgi:hypothetical protein